MDWIDCGDFPLFLAIHRIDRPIFRIFIINALASSTGTMAFFFLA
jgi:hypothetical protein